MMAEKLLKWSPNPTAYYNKNITKSFISMNIHYTGKTDKACLFLISKAPGWKLEAENLHIFILVVSY